MANLDQKQLLDIARCGSRWDYDALIGAVDALRRQGIISTNTNTLEDTFLGMIMCYGPNGKTVIESFCDQCPYFKYRDCSYRLRRDTIYYLEAALKLNIRKGGD